MDKRPEQQSELRTGGTKAKKDAPALRRVTVFGGSGFIGKDLARAFRDDNVHVSIAVRNADRSALSELAGEAHNVEVTSADVTEFETVVKAIMGSDAVVNLVGILYEKGTQTFARVHEQGARNVARAAKTADVAHLVHMSALGASPTSPSMYAQTKAGGEQAVREEFPAATIVRPSIVFGPDDDFFNRFAGIARYLPLLPLIGGGETRFQPVYVDDVVRAFTTIVGNQDYQGKTYELTGPQTYTFRQLMELLLNTMGIRRFLVPIPFVAAEVEGAFLQLLPKPPLTRDQVELLKTDNVAGGDEPGLAELGIKPTALEAVLPSYVR